MRPMWLLSVKLKEDLRETVFYRGRLRETTIWWCLSGELNG